MSSTKAIARTLPRKAPNTGRHHATLDGLGRFKFAIFHTAPFDEEGRHQLETSINSGELSTNSSKLAPQLDFSELQDVYNYFINLRDRDDTIHPLYFIVGDRINPRDGVLVVLLNSSQDEEDVIGVGCCGVDMADSWGANIDIGNQDWLDLKEEEAELWGGDDPYTRDERDGVDDAPSERVEMKTYGWYSLVQKAVPLNCMLEPGWLGMKPGQSRFQMLGNFCSSSDPWTEIRVAHPRQYVIRPHIYQTLILVIEKEDADQLEGVALVRLKWDEDTTGVEDANPAFKPEIDIMSKVSADKALEALEEANLTIQ